MSLANAVAAALGCDAAFILTPPGTGKNPTIAEIVRRSHEKDKSVLVVSHTTGAADRIILEIAGRMPATECNNGRIIRVGEPQLPIFNRHTALMLKHLAAARIERMAHLTQERLAAEERCADVSRLIDKLAWLADEKEVLEELDQKMTDLREKKRLLDRRRRLLKEMSTRVLFWREAAEEAGRMHKIEAETVQLTERLNALSDEISDTQAKLDATAARHAKAQDLYERTSSAGWLSRQIRQLPTPEQQKNVLDRLELTSALLRKLIDDRKSIHDALAKDKDAFDRALETFNRTYPGGRDDILKQRTFCRKQYEAMNRQTKKLNKDYHRSRISMAGLLNTRLKALYSRGLTHVSGGTPEIVLNAIRKGYAGARSETRDLNIDSLRSEHARLEREIAAYRDAIIAAHREIGLTETIQDDDSVDTDGMEARILAEAAVVVTTLSQAFMRDGIQSRKFDVVIIDQAAMIPVPAVWLAAGLAEKHAVVIGDPAQVTSAVISGGRMARQWLGRDIFETAGWIETTPGHPCCAVLHRRYDIHPRIAALAAGMRRGLENSGGTMPPEIGPPDAERLPGNSVELPEWYNAAWGHDAPILMIDIGSSNAWISRVAGDDPADRINLVSAALCVRTAAAVLRTDRMPAAAGDDPRVLIVAPYAAQAFLLDLLIRRERLENDIRAGTPESLRAAAAPVVIVDMVEDDPYTGAPMFRPSADAVTLRRINTLLAGVRCRLVVVGNFRYIKTRARSAVTGGRFMPALRNGAAVIPAADLIRTTMSTEAPDRRSTGDAPQDPPAFTAAAGEDDFIDVLGKDIESAGHQVILYSPAPDASGLDRLKKPLLAALKNDVRIYVVTRPLTERRKDAVESCRLIERKLKEWGAAVIHQMRLHEKMVLIDAEICWFGSFDPLGDPLGRFEPADAAGCGVMERRRGKDLAAAVIGKLGVNALVGAWDDPGHARCPICGKEMVAAVGEHLPYYWRCIEKGCYLRTIDQPAAPATQDMVRCARCGGEVEFGTWGGKPCWRCLANRRHRQPIVRAHLAAPKTAERIPPRALAGLMKTLGMPPPNP